MRNPSRAVRPHVRPGWPALLSRCGPTAVAVGAGILRECAPGERKDISFPRSRAAQISFSDAQRGQQQIPPPVTLERADLSANRNRSGSSARAGCAEAVLLAPGERADLVLDFSDHAG